MPTAIQNSGLMLSSFLPEMIRLPNLLEGTALTPFTE